MRWGVALGLVLGTGCRRAEAPQPTTLQAISADAGPASAQPAPVVVDTSGQEGSLGNPFLTQEERQVAPPMTSLAPPPGEAASPARPIRVEAIVYSPDPSQSRAIMGGRIVRPGDRLGRARLVRIERDAVVVIDEDGAPRELMVPLEQLPGQR